MKEKTRHALLAIGVVGGIGGLAYLLMRNKQTAGASKNLNIIKESFGYLTDIAFDGKTFGLTTIVAGTSYQIDADSFFKQFDDGIAAEETIKSLNPYTEGGTLGTSNPYRAHWIFFDGVNWQYKSVDNN